MSQWQQGANTIMGGRKRKAMKGKKYNDRLVIYQGLAGSLELKADTEKETIWASQAQIADVFGVERSVITKHIRNILKDKELDRDQACANFAHTAGGADSADRRKPAQGQRENDRAGGNDVAGMRFVVTAAI